MKPGAEVAQLSPSALGWRLRHAGAARDFPSLGEAAATLPGQTPFHLGLPSEMVLLEHLTLPGKDRDELEGMAQLQLEKTLPYPVEEVTSGLEVIDEAESESKVISLAVHTPTLEAVCEPLRKDGQIPTRITLFAQAVVAAAAPAERALVVWPEQGHLVLAVSEGGHLAWAQTAPSDEESLAMELPPLLLSAEMNGHVTNFPRVLLASESAVLAPVFREALGCPVELFALDQVTGEGSVDFLPPAWAAESGRQERLERLKQRILMGAVIYLLLVAVAFLFLAWKKRKLQVIQVQSAQVQPLIRATQERRSRWEALAPAVDPHRFTVETLYLINSCRPPQVMITVFDCQPNQFMVEGEAPSSELAIDFSEKMRAEKGLNEFQIPTFIPQILPNGHAQFRIFGKP